MLDKDITVDGGRTIKPNFATLRISYQRANDCTGIRSITRTAFKENLETCAWGELTGYTLNTPCLMIP